MFASANLDIADADTIARWFLYHAGPDDRRALMADLPQVYARAFPSVSTDVITENVRAMLDIRKI